MSRKTYVGDVTLRIVVEADGTFDHEDLQRMFNLLVTNAISTDQLSQHDGAVVSLHAVDAEFLDEEEEGQDVELCDSCQEKLEPGQIGKCEDCQ